MKKVNSKQNCGFFYFKNYFSLMIIMLCSFIGVGFVSGAEIYEFFVRFGKLSFLGIILFFVLCFLLSFKILKFQINNNFSFENKIKINDKIKSNKLLKMSKNDLIKNKITFLNKNSLKNFIVFLNVYFISATMFSGLNNLISNLFNHNFFLILILSFFVTFIFVLIGVKGLEKLDIFVVLFVAIITTFFVSNKSFDLKTIFNFENNILSEKNILALNKILFFGESLFFASLYVFMNILQFEPIVARSGINFSKKSAFFFSLMFALTLSVLLFIFVTFLSAKPELFESQMPFFTYFVSIGGFVSILFSIGMLFCLLSTLMTSLIGLKKILSEKLRWSNFSVSSLSVTICLLMSLLPFKFFVSVIYPFLGFLNLIVFLFL